MFIKFVNQAMGKQNTKFLAPSDLLEKLTSANAATITWCQKPENNESTPTTEAAIIRGKCCRDVGFSSSGFDKKPAKVQCSNLLTVAGEEALEMFNTFSPSDEETGKIDVVIKKFKEYCMQKKNVAYSIVQK